MGNAIWGIIAVLVIGTAVVAYGWLSDRRATREQRAALEAPPDAGPAPTYVTADEAAQARAGRTLSDADRDQLASRLEALPRIDVGRPTADFVTDAPWTVLRRPVVMVCADEIGDMRDLIALLGRLTPPRPPLVLVAPGFDRAFLQTLAVNFTRQTLAALPVRADEAARARICEWTHATPVPAADLHAGYIEANSLGACAMWVSDAAHSWVEIDDEPST